MHDENIYKCTYKHINIEYGLKEKAMQTTKTYRFLASL